MKERDRLLIASLVSAVDRLTVAIERPAHVSAAHPLHLINNKLRAIQQEMEKWRCERNGEEWQPPETISHLSILSIGAIDESS